MASWFVCKPCAGSDPTQDTVKVNIKELDKENLQPAQLNTKSDAKVEDAKEKKLAEDRRKQAEGEAKRRKEEAAAAEAQRKEEAAAAEAQRLREQMKQAAEKLAEEKTKREAEERAQLQAVEKARREAAEEAQRVLLVQQAAEEQAKHEEAVKLAAEEAVKLAAEVAAAQERVNEWCKQNGYRDMNTQKKTMRGATKFPLHTAVKHQNEEMVRLLVKCGVDQGVRGSKHQTPKELAATLNTNRSHDEIIALLH